MTLIKYKPETEQALKDDRVRRFVFFDFMFLPKRVHDGDSTIEWDGHSWTGIGETLAEGFSAQQTSFVGGPPPIGGSTIGSLTASLPLDKELSEVLAKGYYRQGSKMTWMLCAMDESGHGVIERVAITGPYTITQHTTKGNLVTFTSVDEMCGARKDVDEKRKDDKDFIRQSFKWALAGGGTSMALGMTLNSVVALTVNWFGFAVDLALFLLPSRRRALLQRWRARKNVYWFTTEPVIPRVLQRKRGYKIRADTLEEAKEILWQEIAAKVWFFDRGYIRVVVHPEGSAPVMFNIDVIRKELDPDRWERTNPMPPEWRREPGE